MSFEHFMTVGIDTGVGQCRVCGALVPVDMQAKHEAYHAFVAEAVRLRGAK